jgi:hypothetical protein
MHDYGNLCADVWFAWKAIMNLRKAGEDIAEEVRQMKERERG